MTDFDAKKHLQQRFAEQAQPLEQGYQSERDSTIMATLAKYKTRAPEELAPDVQMALQAKLMDVKSSWAQKKQRLINQYRPTVDAMNEIDNMAAAGGLAIDPEAVKARMVLPPEVAAQMYPDNNVDPMERGQKLKAHRSRLESQLKEFEVIAPDERGAGQPWYQRKLPAGVANRINVKTNVIEKFDKHGNPVYESRPANQDELRRWAVITEQYRQVREQEAEVGRQVLGLTKERTAIAGRDGPGGFAEKASAAQKVPAPPEEKVIRVKHKASGQTGTLPAGEFNEDEYERI